MIEPWSPAKLFESLDEAARWNALISWSQRALPLGQPNASFAFAPTTAPEAGVFAFAAESGAELAFRLVPMDLPFKDWVGVDLAAADLKALPEGLREAIGQSLVDLIWGALPENRLARACISDSGLLAALAPLAGRAEWFETVFAGLAPAPIRCLIGFPVAALLEALRREQVAMEAVKTAWAGQVAAEADFTLGELELRIAEFRALGPGDAVVLAPLEDDLAQVRALGRKFVFQAQKGGFVCVGAEAHERGRAASPEEREGGVMGEESGGLSVIVDFDLGRTTMTLAELEAWKPGVVVPLSPPARAEGAQVTLRVNGRAVGEGDLVRIDDRLAVLITRLNLSV